MPTLKIGFVQFYVIACKSNNYCLITKLDLKPMKPIDFTLKTSTKLFHVEFVFDCLNLMLISFKWRLSKIKDKL